MKINGARLLDNLHNLREFTDTPGEGVTRFSYSPQEANAREYIIRRAEAAGCDIYVDALQNIHIGLKSNKPGRKTVVAGSHIDTVQNGGWLDGILGVTGALEVMETLSENISDPDSSKTNDGDEINYNYQLIIFAEEEGSNFGSTMTGSKFLVGLYNEENLDKLADNNGRTLRQALEALDEIPDSANCGTPLYNRGPVDVSDVRIDLENIKSMFELHIEQGPVLEREGHRMGIVDCIFGMRVVEITLTGVGNHAGATPMVERYDALCTAAEAILAAEAVVRDDEDKRTVVTMGHIECLPNQSNVIPETVKFTMEVRDSDNDKINSFMDKCIEAIEEVAAARGVKCQVREHSKAAPIQLSERIIGEMVKRADGQSLDYKVMNSGAVHDACMLAYTVETGMIFTPSINGRSHVPEEDTNEEDLVLGAQFLMDTILDELTN
ncbi:MAG: M20 family metallo-hydrolase [Eubacterium sp.]|nr:M20 family metallo-hydrolase [Candidatus Colimonas fimequi]